MNGGEHELDEEPRAVKPRRIDGPHATGLKMADRSTVAAQELVAASAGESATSLAWSGDGGDALEGMLELEESQGSREEQLQQQAAQLADQLQAQLRELESRESYQNARAAELDNDFRRARLWISEKSAELQERETAVAAAEARLAAARAEAERQLTLSEESAASEAAQMLRRSEAGLREVEARQEVLLQSEQVLAHRQQIFAHREEELSERDRQLESQEFAL
ncbi:MAG TPA: hypothetical protein VFV87_02160, partial [Pirellulaceae bacterium]|nr:hypothetical protein [Pirellulaceae bacterium]